MSLTDTLCTRCGLCCDGSLFADVELGRGREVATLEILGLEVEEGDASGSSVLVLPCRGLAGTRCTVYAQRPRVCRTFECRLLQRARRGDVEVERALETIAEARGRITRIEELCAALGSRGRRLPLAERCAETLARFDAGSSNLTRRGLRDELEAAMTSLDELLHEQFLTGSGQ